MRKQSVARIILVNFLRTIGVMVLLVGVGVLSYYLTMLYLRQTDKVERSTTYTHVIPVSAGTESSNLIYSYNKDSGKIEGMILELFAQDTKNMTYITIPANTAVSIGSDTYAKLTQVNQSLPQTVVMSDIPNYFAGDVAFEYGIMILQEQLPVDIGYFTAIPSDKFNVYYKFGEKLDDCYTPTDAYISTLKKCTTEGDMKDLIEDMWDEQYSDITLQQKENYAAALAGVNWDYVHAYAAIGTKDGENFTIDGKKTKKLVNKVWESDPYSDSQFKTSSGEEADAGTQNIEIQNASQITGLAARYQSRMQEDGLSVVNIGNFQGMKQDKTTIYARNKKWAKKNLRSYFPKPKKVTVKANTDFPIEPGKKDPFEEGIDVVVVLGVDADK
ncbi:MAG: LytR C-terminal domain-containing protein [Eubacterium sp.]|nr:LytR C-terminal domain-containing protein [Eubacterium sp.]